MDHEQRLREIIRKRLDEMTATGNVAGYLTPRAFVGDEHDNTSHIKKVAKQIGYSLTHRGEEDTKHGDKLESINEETMIGARGGIVDKIKFSSISGNAFRGNNPANTRKVEELTSLIGYTMTDKGKEHHMRPADHHEDSRRSMKDLQAQSLRGDYTPLKGEDLEATKANKTHQVVRSLAETDIKGRLVTTKKIINKLNENYYEYRNNPEKLPHQKIGAAISEVNRQLKLIERAIRLNSRLKKECGVPNDMLWKRTKHQMTKLEGRLIELAGRLREMRG